MIEHSILIHSRNDARFIHDCVDSVLAQTEPPEEIIVYDSGSTDGTLALLRAYGDRIRLIKGDRPVRSPHLVDAHAVQSAFAASRGQIIFLLEGDDRFKPEKVARYRAAFDQHPDAAIVQAPVERIDQRGRSLGVHLEPRFHITHHLREIYRRQDVNFFYPMSALALSRNYLERVLPLELDDDLPLWTDARLCMPAAYFGRIVTLLDPLTDWRRHTSTDNARDRSHALQVRQAFMRARVFNRFCRRHNLQTISPWLNRRLYLHLLSQTLPPRIAERCIRPVRQLIEWFA
jgi:glycosyltransferase involved in cell wall biosynthesis